MYDVIIIGGGPAGLTAGIYCSRYNLKTLVLGNSAKGSIVYAWDIENFPSQEKISGTELVDKLKKQVSNFKGEFKEEDVLEIKKEANLKVTTRDNTYEAKTVILAMGTEHRKLGKGEDKFLGKGVSYCATCDGAFFSGKEVAVIGGNDSAVASAILLSQYASKVYIIYRKAKIRAEPFWIEKLEQNDKIEVINNSEIEEIIGESFVEKVKLSTGKELEVQGIFIEIGSVPSVHAASKLKVELCEDDCIKVDEKQATNIEGLYAAGDITNASNNFRQVVTACSEGAIAANSVFKFLKN